MKNFTAEWLLVGALVGALVAGGLGCGSMSDNDTGPSVRATTAALEQGVVVDTVYDDSASPVHIQIKSCSSTVTSELQRVDCRVDLEYALVGGGAAPLADGTGTAQACLVESRPVDGRTWRAASTDHLIAQPHDLTVHAIGMRLDGVNTQVLRDSIDWKSSQSNGPIAFRQNDADALLLGGGAQTEAAPGETGHRFLTASAPAGFGWVAASRDHFGSVPGTTEVTLLQIENRIIEGFGALEVAHLFGSAVSASGGVVSSTAQAQEGWAMISMGGSVTTVAGAAGRMITAIEPCANARCLTISSSDQIAPSAGTAQAYISQVRKVPGSHGLCNPGTALAPSMDGCVASICAARSECCSAAWDATCVAMTETVCRRSCAQHTCIRSPLQQDKWELEDDTAVPSNCYYYAQNKYPDGSAMVPGGSLNPLESDYAESDFDTVERYPALAAGEGLIPSSFAAECPDNRTKVMISASSHSYHWYRQDVSGAWSDKPGVGGFVTLTPNTGVRPYVDIQTSPIQEFFCACNQALPD